MLSKLLELRTGVNSVVVKVDPGTDGATDIASIHTFLDHLMKQPGRVKVSSVFHTRMKSTKDGEKVVREEGVLIEADGFREVMIFIDDNV